MIDILNLRGVLSQSNIEDAFPQLVPLLTPSIRTIAAAHTNRFISFEDVVAHCQAQLWNKFESFRLSAQTKSDSHLEHSIYLTIKNLVIDLLRTYSAETPPFDEDAAADQDYRRFIADRRREAEQDFMSSLLVEIVSRFTDDRVALAILFSLWAQESEPYIALGISRSAYYRKLDQIRTTLESLQPRGLMKQYVKKNSGSMLPGDEQRLIAWRDRGVTWTWIAATLNMSGPKVREAHKLALEKLKPTKILLKVKDPV